MIHIPTIFGAMDLQRTILTSIVAMLVVGVMVYSLMPKQPEETYGQKVQRMRGEKLEYFAKNSSSPIADPDDIDRIDWFDVDSQYVLEAVAERTTGDTVMIVMSDGVREKFYKYGIASFKFRGKDLSLAVYSKEDKPKKNALLFVPFLDKTNGISTYGGGRYLDVPMAKGDRLTLDFNMAYNPYCTYNDSYICPVPPSSNMLDIEVRAGEKALKEKED